jgi:hypothetical protein
MSKKNNRTAMKDSGNYVTGIALDKALHIFTTQKNSQTFRAIVMPPLENADLNFHLEEADQNISINAGTVECTVTVQNAGSTPEKTNFLCVTHGNLNAIAVLKY